MLFLGGTVDVAAQYTATITIPSDGSIDNSTTPTLVVTGSSSLDSSSVSWNADRADSTFSVSIARKELVDSLDAAGSEWYPIQLTGTFSMPQPNELHFEMDGSLYYNTEYIAITHGIQVLDGQQNPHLVDPDTITFTTQYAPHYLLTSSHGIDDPLCPCDTIRLTFNRPLDSTESAAGPIAVLERMHVDSTYRWGDSATAVDVNYSLNQDSTILSLEPTDSLVQGAEYRLRVLASRLSGDTLDDREYAHTAPKHWSVEVVNIDEQNGDTLEGFSRAVPIDSMVGMYGLGDSAHLAVGYKAGYEFQRWIAPSIPTIDSSDSESVAFAVACGDEIVFAEFRARDYDSLEVKAADSGGYATAYSVALDSLGGPGTYGYAEGDPIYVKALEEEGYEFSHWTSNDAGLNNLTSPVIDITETTGWIKPWFEDPFGEPDYMYCGGIIGTEAAHATLSTTCHTTEEAASRTITCSITDPTGTGECARITGRINPDGTTADFEANPKTSDPLAWQTDTDVPRAYWVVDTYPDYALTVNREDEDGNPIMGNANATVDITPDLDSYPCGTVVTLTAYDSPANDVAFEKWMPGGSTSKSITFTMDENKTYTAVFGDAFAVVGYRWYEGSTTNTSFVDYNDDARDVRIPAVSGTDYPTMWVYFNESVNVNSVTPENFFIEENRKRIDGKPRHRYTLDNCESFWSENNSVLKVNLYDEAEDIAVKRFQILSVHVKDAGIESADGADLDNPHIHQAYTAMPDVRWELEKVWITYDCDPDPIIPFHITDKGEIYGFYNAIHSDDDGPIQQWADSMPQGGGYEQVDAHDETATSTIADNKSVLVPVSTKSTIGMGVVIMESDGDDVRDAMSAILSVAGIGIGALATNGLLLPEDAGKVVGEIVQAIGGEIGDLSDASDDFVTHTDWVFGRTDGWGWEASDVRRTMWSGYGGLKLKVTLE